MNRIDKTSDLLERLLDTASRRQTLISSNIANVDTPGFSTRDVDFARAMEEADRAGVPPVGLRATAPGHLVGDGAEPARPFEFEPRDLPRRNDQNNVSMDREMLALAWTAGRYSTAIEILRRRFALLRYAIQDGRSG